MHRIYRPPLRCCNMYHMIALTQSCAGNGQITRCPDTIFPLFLLLLLLLLLFAEATDGWVSGIVPKVAVDPRCPANMSGKTCKACLNTKVRYASMNCDTTCIFKFCLGAVDVTNVVT